MSKFIELQDLQSILQGLVHESSLKANHSLQFTFQDGLCPLDRNLKNCSEQTAFYNGECQENCLHKPNISNWFLILDFCSSETRKTRTVEYAVFGVIFKKNKKFNKLKCNHVFFNAIRQGIRSTFERLSCFSSSLKNISSSRNFRRVLLASNSCSPI